MKLKPSDIRYSQDSIGPEFSDSNHGTIIDTFKKLLDGTLQARDLGRIEVGHYLGNWVAFEGNRRLFLFKNLQVAGVLTDIEVRVIRPNTYHLSRKYTTKNSGMSIRVRRYPHIQQEINNIIAQHKNKSTRHSNSNIRANNINKRNQYAHANLSHRSAVNPPSRPGSGYKSNTAPPNINTGMPTLYNSRPVISASSTSARPNTKQATRQYIPDYSTEANTPSYSFRSTNPGPAFPPVQISRANTNISSASTRANNSQPNVLTTDQLNISFRDSDGDTLTEQQTSSKRCCCVIS